MGCTQLPKEGRLDVMSEEGICLVEMAAGGDLGSVRR